MEQVFSYIIGLGAAVMMPILFFILGVCIGIKPGKALKSGLLVGVGFVGLSVVTALLTSSLGAPLKDVTEIYGLQLRIFDMGWPAAASVAYNTTVGAFIIPVCLAINIVLLLCKATNTINRHHLLCDYAGNGRSYHQEVPELLQGFGRYFYPAAVLPGFRSVRRRPELVHGPHSRLQ